MLLINGITDEAKQKMTMTLDDGSQVSLSIEYKPNQLGWFLTNLTYNDFQINGIRLVTSPDILYQFKNQLPFGLAVFVQDNQEATLQQDFSSGRAQLYIVTADEVEIFENYLSGN